MIDEVLFLNSKKNFKDGIHLSCTILGHNYTKSGFTDNFEALVDYGANSCVISVQLFANVLQEILDKKGKPLTSVGSALVQGVNGDEVISPVYVLPYLWLDSKIKISDVAVVVSESDRFEFIIGRSVLRHFYAKIDPMENSISLEYIPDQTPHVYKFDDGSELASLSSIRNNFMDMEDELAVSNNRIESARFISTSSVFKKNT